MLFLTKDRSLAIPLLEGLLKYWPFANCVKETLFLTELQEVLEVCEVEKVEPLIPCFKVLLYLYILNLFYPLIYSTIITESLYVCLHATRFFPSIIFPIIRILEELELFFTILTLYCEVSSPPAYVPRLPPAVLSQYRRYFLFRTI